MKVSQKNTAIEIKFAPKKRNAEEILSFVDRLEARLKGKKGRRRKQNGPGV
jgi:hypothetical protein